MGWPYLLAARCAPARRMSAECQRRSFKFLSSISVIGGPWGSLGEYRLFGGGRSGEGGLRPLLGGNRLFV